MKVLVKSDRVPIVLMIIGSAFAVASILSTAVRYYRVMFPMGLLLLLFGFLLWAVPTYLKYQRKKSRQRSKRTGENTEGSQPRRYARPRR